MISTDNRSISKPLDGAGLLTGHYYDPYPARFAANVKELLAKGYPMVSRMHAGVRYAMNDEHLFGSTDLEGHVTIMAGYDDLRGTFQYADPWPSETGGRMEVEETEEEGAGVVAMNASLDYACTGIPLPVSIEVLPVGIDHARVQVTVSLRLPNAVRCGVTDLEGLGIRLALPEGVITDDPTERRVESLTAGESVTLEWIVQLDGRFSAGEIRAVAAGLGRGTDPYQWSDVIGGQALLDVRSTSAVPAGLSVTVA